MKTQVSILVKNATIFARTARLMWFIDLFRKMPVDVTIDTEGNTQRLKASNEPYLIDVEPGEHVIVFTDPYEAKRKGYAKLSGAMIGGIFGLATGNGTTAMIGADIGATAADDNTVRDNAVECTLNEGDVLRVQVRPTRKGSVKVKIL